MHTSDLLLPSCAWVSVLCTHQVFCCPAAFWVSVLCVHIRSFATQLLFGSVCCVHIRSFAAWLLLGKRAFSRMQLEGNWAEAVGYWQAVQR